MSIVNDVIAIIRNNPGITAAEIKECAGINDATTKAILWRLSESNRITRQKTAAGKQKGPRAVFAYQLKELDHGVQEKETRTEVTTEV
jgi:predicted transcriptional regulator